MATTKTTPDKGNLIGFLNRTRTKDQPIFRGKITLPGHEDDRAFALWATESQKGGAIVLSGRATDSATAQIERHVKGDQDKEPPRVIPQREGGEQLTIETNALLLFTNKQKDADHASRPDYWGYYNPGGKEPLMRLAAWAKTDQRGNAMLTGSLQKDEPRRDRDEAERDEQEQVLAREQEQELERTR